MIIKVTHFLFCVFIFVVFSKTDTIVSINDTINSPHDTVSAIKGNRQKSIPVILFCGAGENSVKTQIRNGWFSAIMDAHFQLRSIPVKEIKTISSDSLYRYIRSSGKYSPGHYGLSIKLDVAAKAGVNLNADYIINSFYEVNEQNNIVLLSVEIYSIKSKKTIGVFEKNFGYEEIGHTLDSAFFTICNSVGVSWTDEEKKSIFKDISAPSIKAAKKTGNAFIRYIESADTKMRENAIAGLNKNVIAHPAFALATYLYAYSCERQGDLENAARMYNTLTRRNGLYYPLLYSKILRFFRLSHVNDLATRTMTVADKKGIESPEYIVEKARLLQKTGGKKEIAEVYKKSLLLDPNYGEALIYLAKYYNKTKKYEEAQSCAERLIANKDYIGEAYLELGTSFLNREKYSKALLALAIADKKMSDNTELANTLGLLYYRTEDYNNASKHLTKALTATKIDEKLLLSCADAFIKSGKDKNALEILLKYKASFTSSKIIEKKIGLLYYALNDTSNALIYLENCIAIEPPDYKVFLALAEIYGLYGRNNDAIDMYEKAKPFVDDKNLITFSMAKLSLTMKDYVTAKKKLQKIIAKTPSFKGANYLLGEISEINKEPKAALSWYSRERKYNSANIALQRKIAELSYSLNLFGQTKKESLRLLEMDSSETIAYVHLALVNLQENNFSEAEKYSNKAKESAGFDKIFYKTLGKGYAKADKFKEAIDAYDTYLSTVIDDDSAWIELGILYKNTGDDTLCARAYCMAYGLNRSLEHLYAEAGHIYYKYNDIKRSKQLYETFIKNGNRDNQVAYNLASILFNEKKYHRTIALLTLLSDEFKNKLNVQKMLAISLYSINQFKSAQPYISKYLSQKPNEKEFVEMAAIAFEKNNDLETSAIHYKKYLTLEKDTLQSEYAYHLAILYEKLNRYSDMVTQLRSNILKYPTELKNNVKLAEVYEKQKKYVAVISLCTETAKNTDAPMIIYKYLANAYYAQNDRVSALTWYERYLIDVPDDACIKIVADIYYLDQNYQMAIKNYSMYLNNNDGMSNDYFKLGNSYFEISEFLKASNYFEQVSATGDSLSRKSIILLTTCYENLLDTTSLINNLLNRTSIEKSNYALNKRLADLLTTVDRSDEAILIYENMTDIKPSDIETHKKLAQIYLYKNSFSKAKKHLKSALRYAPENTDIRYIKAKCHLALRENAKAEKSLKKVIFQKPSMHEARYEYAILLNQKGEYTKALSQLKSAVRTHPKSVSYLLETVGTALKLNQVKTARAYIERALDIKPDDEAIIKTAGLVYAACKEYSLAIDYLTQAISIKPISEECVFTLGKIHFVENNFEMAIPLLTQVNITPVYKYESLVMLGDIANEHGKKKKAEGYFNKAFLLKSTDSKLLYKLISANLSLKRVRKASKILSRNRRIKRDGWVELARGSVFEKKGSLNKAWDAFASARKYLPKNFSVISGQGRVRYKQKKYSSALPYLRVACGYNDTIASIHFMIGESYYHTKNYTKATISLDKSVDIQPDQSKSYFTLGIIYDKRKNYTAAIRNYSLTINNDTRNWEAHYRLAKIQKTRKEYSFAADHYLKAYQYNKNKKLGLEIFKIVGDIYYTQLPNTRKAKKYYRKYIRMGGKNKIVADRFTKLETM